MTPLQKWLVIGWMGLVTLGAGLGASVWAEFHLHRAGMARVGGVEVGITRFQFLDTIIAQMFSQKEEGK